MYFIYNSSQHVEFIIHLCLFHIGYVDSLQEILFSLSRKEMKAVLSKYQKKTPKPLNSQFPEKLPKAEAVKKFQVDHKKSITQLFPPGTVLGQNVLGFPVPK